MVIFYAVCCINWIYLVQVQCAALHLQQFNKHRDDSALTYWDSFYMSYAVK
jgi:hypothetical protein